MDIIIDSRDLGEFEGFELKAFITADCDPKPQEYDCYSAEDIEAWSSDDWGFVIVAVVASRNGIELGYDYLSAVEHGYFPGPDGSYFINALDRISDHAMVETAVADARTALAGLIR